jgi:hypothetical protein
MTIRKILLTSSFFLAGMGAALAQEASTPSGQVYKSNVPPSQRRVFFGELHMHTAMSFDAWGFGTKILPDTAYKFARGETVTVPASQLGLEQGIKSGGDVKATRAWPLDFMAVTDHSEAMGVLNQFDDPNNPLAKTPMGEQIIKNPKMS